MKQQHVICVKIAQQTLNYYGQQNVSNPYSVFPYDRVYLVKTHILPQFTRTFRYYFSMPLESRLLTALNRLSVANVHSTHVKRDNLAREGCAGARTNNFVELIRKPKKWTLIVPTHVRSVKYIKNGIKGTDEKTEHTVSVVQYFFTEAINGSQRNSTVRMPRITFHTPDRTIPVACAICKNTPAFYANECSPGTWECKRGHKVHLKEDKHFKQTQEQSAEETGGTE